MDYGGLSWIKIDHGLSWIIVDEWVMDYGLSWTIVDYCGTLWIIVDS